MGRDERAQLRQLVREAIDLADEADEILSGREHVDEAVRRDVARMRARGVEVSREERLAWRVLPVMPDDAHVASNLAAVRDRVPLSAGELATLERLRTVVGDTARAAEPLSKARFLPGRKKLAPARVAAEALPALVVEPRALGLLERLRDLVDPQSPAAQPGVERILDRSLRFEHHLRVESSGSELVRRTAFDGLARSVSLLDKAVADEQRYVDGAKAAGERVRSADVRRLVESMPLEALKPMTRGQLSLKPLLAAGVTNVQTLLDRASSLESIRGVGRETARRALGAAMSLFQITREDTPVRIDVKERSSATTELLERLRAWDGVRLTRGAALDLARADELRGLARALGTKATHAIVLPVDSIPSEALLTSINAVVRRAEIVRDATPSGAARGNVWDDFLSRPADYFALLAELGFVTEDTKKAHGDLPDAVIEAVRAQELLTDNLKASLRGYQSFAARFALVQDKVIIGDEMGLGKTVEALATLAHLRSKGEQHFLVVCPAAVVSNWVRETHRHTTLRAHRLHGSFLDRRSALRSWARMGGVAITTYDLLGWARTTQPVDVECVVVDEAHYIKNPKTKRAQNTSAVIEASPRALLMSGTPLENRVEEFRNLVSYFRPELARAASEVSAVKFRRQVAPVYLRRNQEDVLTELPELVEIEEWLGMSDSDQAQYRRAVVGSNFAAMRRAALLSTESEKFKASARDRRGGRGQRPARDRLLLLS